MAEQRIAVLVATAYDVSSRLRFCGSNTTAERDFGKFADNVNAFASAWSIIQPSLRDPSVRLSPSLLRILDLISNDCTVILAYLRESITTLSSHRSKIGTAATRNVFLRLGSQHSARLLQLQTSFLNQQMVVLCRSQIILATSTLNVILVVIHHGKAGPQRQHRELHIHNESQLLQEQQRARAKVEAEEALATGHRVRATLWLQRLPEAQTGVSIIDILAREWIQPVPHTAQQGPNNDARLERHLEQLEGRLQEQEQRDRQTTRMLQEQDRRGKKADIIIADLKRSRQDDQNRIQLLESQRQDDQNRIQLLDFRLQEQEQKIKKDGLLIAQLREECQQLQEKDHNLSAYCAQKEDEVEQLQAALDTRNREMQQLGQRYRALKTKSERQTLQLEPVLVDNDDLRRENVTLREENKKGKQQRERLEEERESCEEALARIRRERDSWRKEASNLRDRIKTQPPMGPTSYRSSRSSRRDSDSSRSSGRTYVGSSSSRESSKERRSWFPGINPR